MSETSLSRTPELLSPAGNWDCARAAVANGADAIFFGLPAFNARLRADNFTEADLPELMDFLHAHGVKGFVTMNTLIFTREMGAAERQLRLLRESGVDAIIVQDLGLARLCRMVAPEIEIHASTQMTITSPEGLGFIDGLFQLERAVLARELSLREIQRFKPLESVPLEVFVHGALCVAYSGQCLTSESLGQRSANRGECAQACRMPYELVVDGKTMDMGDKRYLLSPQDLAAVDVIPDLVKAGVVSYKIEGRLKSPEYVAAVTRVYRKAIDAALEGVEVSERVTERDRYALEMTFSRGLTTGWLEGTNHPKLTHGRFGKKRGARLGRIVELGNDWVRIDQIHPLPVQAGDGVVFDAGEDRNEEQGGRIWKVEGDRFKFHYKHSGVDFRRIKVGQEIWKTDDPQLNAEVRKLWKNAKLEPQRDGLKLKVEGSLGEELVLTDLSSGLQVRSEVKLEQAENRPLNQEVLEKQLGRLGGTAYELASVELDLKGDLILPVSALNRLRRALVAALDARPEEESSRQQAVEATFVDLMPKVQPAERGQGAANLSVLCRDLEQIEAACAAGVGRVYADFEDIRRGADAVRAVRESGAATEIFLATPRIQKAGESGYFKVLERAEPDGILVRNLGAIGFFADSEQLRLVGDFSLNVANPITASLLMAATNFEHLTVSYDLNSGQVEDLLRGCPEGWFEVTLHQHMPMFHMEHCVFCTFLSEGTSYKDCGRPCEEHQVQLRDRVGQLHTLQADVGCRNTLFNGRAQTGARFYKGFRAAGAERFRIELVNETGAETTRVIEAYQALLSGSSGGEDLWTELGAMEKLGVTEGTLLKS